MYNLKEVMMKVLSDAKWKTADLGIDKILATWEANKAGLLTMFRQYPTWNEERKMIVFSHEYEREIDYSACESFGDWLYCTRDNKIEGFDNSNIDYSSSIFYVIGRYICSGVQTLDEGQADSINQYMPELKVRAGQKFSKVANKFLTKLGFNTHPDYNRRFAKYSDAINPLKTKRHTCISVNPIDFLLMSNGNSWTSCHQTTLYNEDRHGGERVYGCYCSGSMSYLLDGTSFLFYTVDDKYDGEELELQPKITRQVFNYHEGKLVQGRLYPQSWDDNCDSAYADTRSTVQKIIADCLGAPNMWKLEDGHLEDRKDITTVEGATNYEDYFENGCCKFSVLKGIAQEDAVIRIGHPPMCLECGEEFSVQQSLSCCDREMVVKCDDCGEITYIRNTRRNSDTGEHYCPSCSEWCRRCERWHRMSDYHHVDKVGYICDACFESAYILCPVCNRYEQEELMFILDGVQMCGRCRDKKYVRCEDCYEWIKKENAVLRSSSCWGQKFMCLDCKERRDAAESARKKREEERAMRENEARAGGLESEEELRINIESPFQFDGASYVTDGAAHSILNEMTRSNDFVATVDMAREATF